ncbi:MAG TPA: class I SAM-dependent methyltransferase [Acidimicrobiia bacterium]|nr:class I SAM-dependent methyltransferase [Acidimicrobiia bacterium]
MTLTVVVGRNATTRMDAAAFAELREHYDATFVDVGTGDGRFVAHLAAEWPEALVIGIDTAEDNMAEAANKARRKRGTANALFVRSAIEALPQVLHHVADLVFVQLPWGRLLEGIVLGDAAVVGGIAALCRPGARVEVNLNNEIWLDSTPERFADLPLPTPEYVDRVIAPAFATAGIDLGPARMLGAEQAKALPTTWAKRLGHSREHPKFVHVEGTAR